ncbi:acetyltransferase [Rhexocercosporidium sp. MPI-PUGE-AT-0058]|nr:acetyltransferase [Rhexocercosporidium sp. MPI-PUGE-AT-0058]
MGLAPCTVLFDHATSLYPAPTFHTASRTERTRSAFLNKELFKMDKLLTTVREASKSLGDTEFIVEAFDSTLPYLSSIGSGEQWGSIPFSQCDGFLQETLDSLEQSEKYSKTRTGQATCVLIAEVEVEGMGSLLPGVRRRKDENRKLLLSVGTATIHGEWFPEYLTSQAHLGLAEVKDFTYIGVMVTDHRTGSFRQSVGGDLMQSIVKYGRSAGKKAIYVDGWAGNGRKLIRYYESLGFRILGEFSMTRNNGSIWPGTLLKMDLS